MEESLYWQYSPEGALATITSNTEEVLTKVTVHRTPNFRWMYTLQPGDSWTPHPAGGILVVNPKRKPLWCHVEDGYLVQEWLE